MVDTLDNYLLVGANVVVFSALAAQIALRRRKKVVKAPDITAAFKELQRALETSDLGLPPGYTLREGIGKARGLGLNVEWDSVGRALSAYEGEVYGGKKDQGVEYSEILSLSRELKEVGART